MIVGDFSTTGDFGDTSFDFFADYFKVILLLLPDWIREREDLDTFSVFFELLSLFEKGRAEETSGSKLGSLSIILKNCSNFLVIGNLVEAV